jgi:HEPN domain-containing protein/predicted nucleotidyltransferase
VLQTLDDVVRRLVDRYDADRIILYGSRVGDRARPDSDIDLLIVKETDKRPVERRIEVERLLLDRAPKLDLDVLVFTPRELRELYFVGSPFIEEVMETGRVLYMRKVTAVWIREAEDDSRSAQLLVEHGHYRAACIHSQQAVEKALKALLLEKGQRPPRTHNLIVLLGLVGEVGFQVMMPTDDAVFLNNVYRGRYPSEEGLLPHGEPEVDDARRAVSAAGAFLADTKQALSD